MAVASNVCLSSDIRSDDLGRDSVVLMARPSHLCYLIPPEQPEAGCACLNFRLSSLPTSYICCTGYIKPSFSNSHTHKITQWRVPQYSTTWTSTWSSKSFLIPSSVRGTILTCETTTEYVSYYQAPSLCSLFPCSISSRALNRPTQSLSLQRRTASPYLCFVSKRPP